MNFIGVNFLRSTIKFHVLRIHQSGFEKTVFYSSSQYKTNQNNESSERKKTKPIPKISLINEDSKMEVITLDAAKKIAEKRQLKLVNLIDYDTKSKRAVYKLMTSHDYHAEELKKREEKKLARNQPHIKSEKLLSLSNKITEHDLMSKVIKCKKWIEKNHEIRVVVNADDGDIPKAEKISGIVENEIKLVEGRVLQKRTKDNTIKFTIMPTLKKEDLHTKGSTEQHEKKLLEQNNLNLHQVRHLHLF